jgi:uncharacterized membrane protein
MSLAPLLAASPLVQAHVVAALAAFCLGLVQFALPKGSPRHRLLGWIWIVIMAIVALSSFGITEVAGPGRFSWIHGLSAYTLFGLVGAIIQARLGKVRAHRNSMIGLFLGALIITGAFALSPGRLMGQVVFGW